MNYVLYGLIGVAASVGVLTIASWTFQLGNYLVSEYLTKNNLVYAFFCWSLERKNGGGFSISSSVAAPSDKCAKGCCENCPKSYDEEE